MSVKIFACGDIFIQESIGCHMMDDLKKLIRSNDIAVCNFEGPIKSGGDKALKVGPHLEQPEDAIAILREAGFNLFSLANNHILDFGENGLSRTIEEIKRTGAEYIGAGNDPAVAYELKIFANNSLRVGFLSFAEYQFGAVNCSDGRGGCAWINHPSIARIVKESRAKVDFLIAIAHAGAECALLPLPEWRIMYKELCDCGVDVIIGHHPHIPQGFEKYNKSLIFYSLGNFYFDHYLFRNIGNVSYSVIFEISKEACNFNIVWHGEKSGSARIIENKACGEYLEKINSFLGERYEDLIDQQTAFLYETRYKRLNDIGYKNAFINLVKHIIVRRGLSPNKEMMYLHNSMIESHRYAMMGAIRLTQYKGKKIDYSEIVALTEDYYRICRQLLA
jgi:poly-gamma-glutamate synthesis protein (capsule biosynthesis protein)